MTDIGFFLARHRKHALEGVNLVTRNAAVSLGQFCRQRDHADGEGNLILLAAVAGTLGLLVAVLVSHRCPGAPTINQSMSGNNAQKGTNRTTDRPTRCSPGNLAPNRHICSVLS